MNLPHDPFPFGTPLERLLIGDATLHKTRCMPVTPDLLDKAIRAVEQKATARRDTDRADEDGAAA